MAGDLARVRHRHDAAVVLALMALCIALVAGWFATGHASAPDDGLQQIDMITLEERVAGVEAVDGRPTMVVVTGQRCPARAPEPRRLDARFGLVLSPDAGLARRLALPKAAEGCTPGYALLDAESQVRYRTYDPSWAQHDEEQEILLEAIEQGHTG